MSKFILIIRYSFKKRCTNKIQNRIQNKQKSGCREVKPVTLLTINEKDNILLHV